MAQALVQRLRGILSSKKDDYFDDIDLLDYLNEGYKSVVSTAIKQEMERSGPGGRSIRALDFLRQDTSFEVTVTTPYRDFYTGNLALNSIRPNADFLTELYIGIPGTTLTEIRSGNKSKLDFGQLKPTQQQGYFEFVRQDRMAFYLKDSGEYVGQITFIRKPDLITESDTTIPDLPDRLIHAVVTRAALMAGTQEIRENRGDYQTLYQSEMAEHLW